MTEVMTGVAYFAILALGVGLGWLTASWRQRVASSKPAPSPTDYYEGLNQLLSDRPEQAINTLLASIALKNETVPTHLLLGGLVRKFGDAEKAIRIHRDILKEANLTASTRREAELELARDYLTAGLLGRAEALLTEILETGGSGADRALMYLLEVFQRERDWQRAVDTAERVGIDNAEIKTAVAQYQCELAHQAIGNGQAEAARGHLQKARALDGSCLRAHLMLGQLAFAASGWQEAMECFHKVIELDRRFVSEVIVMLEHCYRILDKREEFIRLLEQLIRTSSSHAVVAVRTRAELESQGVDAAKRYLTNQLTRTPSIRALGELIELHVLDQPSDEGLFLLQRQIALLLENKPVYRCDNCGFSGRFLHWHCPGCKQWASTAPSRGLEGD